MAFAANRDLCLSFVRRCANYGEMVIGWHLPSVALPMPHHVVAAHASRDLRKRAMKLPSEVTGTSVENATIVKGLSSILIPVDIF